MPRSIPLNNNPLWYKEAIIYQLHVKTFYDSNDDGIGDFRGLTKKLDYLKNLGVTAIWILPFYPSPLRDDGYDIADYYEVHPNYGSLKDFKEFLRQAHKRGLRVITELVINHTSDAHPWFQRARTAKPGSNYRDYYVWSDTPERYADARIIFKDFEPSNWTWDATAHAYYWHRFYSHQPDLNFDNPNVQKEIMRIADFWFGLGVDGVRLDAVPYLFEREGTNCENLPETYAFLKKLRRHIDGKFKNRMLLAEANQWPEDAVAYFGKGDECHMAFHFPLMPRMYMGLQMEDSFPIIDILSQTPEIPKDCQWAIFLRNHDELTLEMVTDEERDYMYKAYAKDARSKINLGIRRRLVPLLGNNRRKVELMNILLFSLPGTPIIYYGDEIGMGDNHFLGDRDGVRTPMQWSPDRNAGFSRTNPQQLYLPVIIDAEHHFATVNVETLEGNLSSLLWWMKRVIAMRQNFKAFSHGTFKMLNSSNSKVLAFMREYKDEKILVIINLSRFCQPLELSLKEYSGCALEEVFSQNRFPVIGDAPYTFTLAPHNHFWFLLKKSRTPMEIPGRKKEIRVDKHWEEVLEEPALGILEKDILPAYVMKCRWYGGKAQAIKHIKVESTVRLEQDGRAFRLAFLRIQMEGGSGQLYLLPLAFVAVHDAGHLTAQHPEAIICPLSTTSADGYLFDGSYAEPFHHLLLNMVRKRRKVRTEGGVLTATRGRQLSAFLKNDTDSHLPSRVLKAEQSNTSVVYDNRIFLKIFRRVEEGVNPDTEILRFLTEKARYAHVPSYAGLIEFQHADKESSVLCVFQECVANQGDAWTYTLDRLGQYFEQALARRRHLEEQFKRENQSTAVQANVQELFRSERQMELMDHFYLEMVALLGQRTAELHSALATEDADKDFCPESFSTLYQRSVYQSMGSQARTVLRLLKEKLAGLPSDMQGEATPVLELEKDIHARLKQIMKTKFSAKKIRIHGDYHLGQVLFTGKDFYIIDFEGEPIRTISQRRLKRSALRDVAGMIRSFHYAAYAALFLRKNVRDEDFAFLEACAESWNAAVTKVFVKSYFETIGKANFLPKGKKELEMLLQVFLLDKALYELGYELNNRPDWVSIPLRGIKFVLNQEAFKELMDF